MSDEDTIPHFGKYLEMNFMMKTVTVLYFYVRLLSFLINFRKMW